jgi:hypothetical protein
MQTSPLALENPPAKPISVGLTCWLWEWKREESIKQLARKMNVTLQLTERRHGLRREIEGHVSGHNVERFLSEFARHV